LRDGFTSLAAGAQAGGVTTRRLTYTGKHLFVNIAAPRGELRVEALDADGRVIESFTRENCAPLSADRTAVEVRRRNAADLSALGRSAGPIPLPPHRRRLVGGQ
jgi:hypothetical protein